MSNEKLTLQTEGTTMKLYMPVFVEFALALIAEMLGKDGFQGT